MDPVRLGSQRFFWLPRTPRMTLANDPQYRSAPLEVLLRAVAGSAAPDEIPDLAEPLAGFVYKPTNRDLYQPCSEFRDGAKPAWIWYTRTAPW